MMAPRRSQRLMEIQAAASANQAQINTLKKLPLELHDIVCEYLSQADLLSLLKTNKCNYAATLPWLFRNGVFTLKFGYGNPNRVLAIRGREDTVFWQKSGGITITTHPRFLRSWSQIQNIDIHIILGCCNPSAGFNKPANNVKPQLALIRKLGHVQSLRRTCTIKLELSTRDQVPTTESVLMRALSTLTAFEKVVVRPFHIQPRWSDRVDRIGNNDILAVEVTLKPSFGPAKFCDAGSGVSLRYNEERDLWCREDGGREVMQPSYLEFYPQNQIEKRM